MQLNEYKADRDLTLEEAQELASAISCYCLPYLGSMLSAERAGNIAQALQFFDESATRLFSTVRSMLVLRGSFEGADRVAARVCLDWLSLQVGYDRLETNSEMEQWTALVLLGVPHELARDLICGVEAA